MLYIPLNLWSSLIIKFLFSTPGCHIACIHHCSDKQQISPVNTFHSAFAGAIWDQVKIGLEREEAAASEQSMFN